MKALWILNSPIGTAAEILGYGAASSGTWIAATERSLKDSIKDLRIDYAVMGYQNRTITDELRSCTVYELNLKRLRGKRMEKDAVQKWTDVLDQEKPDLIHIWGTEFSFPLDVMDVCGNIPVAVSIQGIMASLAKYCRSDISFSELIKGQGILVLPAYLRAKLEEKKMLRQVDIEKKIICRADVIMLEGELAQAFCNSVTCDGEYCYLPLAINEIFSERKWEYDRCEKNSIFTIAPSTHMKGTHVLLKALRIVKKEFPDVKLRIPGSLEKGKLPVITEPPYFRYLRRLVAELDLFKNVEFCGKLSSEQMADYMCRSNLFVMPSRAENLSTTVREALHIGCPCISSLVGVIHETAVHNENLMVYRYEEYEVLAYEIIEMLKDPNRAQELSRNGKSMVQRKYPIGQPLDDCVKWYLKNGGRSNQ